MTIHIAGFWLGVLATIVVEVFFIFLLVIFAGHDES